MYRVLDFVGPEGYIHGWIKVGASDTKTHSTDFEAVKTHFGDETAGHLRDAASAEDKGDVAGAKDHLRKAYDSGAAVIRTGKFGPSKSNAKNGAQALLGDINRHLTRLNNMHMSQSTIGHNASPVMSARVERGLGPWPRGSSHTGSYAALLDLAKGTPASETAAGRKSAYKQGLALRPASPGADPGFPVKDAAHWDMARRAVGRVKNAARRAQLAKLLRKTAPQFGRTKQLAESWAAPGGSKNMANYGYRSLALAAYDDQSAYNGEGASGAKDGNSGYSADSARCKHCSTMNDADANYCDNCGYKMDSARDGQSSQPEVLRTPALGTPQSAGMQPGQIGVSGASSPNLGLANPPGRAIQLSRRPPVANASDIIVGRVGGRAVIRHRQGGDKIGELYKNDAGQWVPVQPDGRELSPRVQQRAGLFDLIGHYNQGTAGGGRPSTTGPALQPPPVQTPMMQQFGVPAIRALATATTSSSSGGRVVMANGGDDGDSDDGSGPAGLNPKGVAIYKKLKAKGMPAARALAFARNSQNATPGKFGRG